MKPLILPDGPRQMFEAVEPVLSRFFSAYRIGGGTVLAGYWRHRQSTDVDLFADPSEYRRVVQVHGPELEAELNRRVPGIDPNRSWVEFETLILDVGGHEVSLLPRERIWPAPPDPDRILGTGVEVETPVEILTRKVRYRMIETGNYPIRDLYDLVWADRTIPDQMDWILSGVSSERLDQMASELDSVWMFDQELLDPADSGTDADFRNRVIQIFRERAKRLRLKSPASEPGSAPPSDPAGPDKPST